MSSLSTFGAFTTARLGIYASQKALDVVGNNISNINTKGYTRQALDQVSLFTGYGDKYTNGLDIRVGNGALVTRVTQLRDPYLDIRYRNEMSTVGYMDAKLSGLEGLSNILDEVAKGEDVDSQLGVLEKQFNDLIEQMQRLNTEGAGLDAYDTNVRTAASSLTKLFNSYASRLDELYGTKEKELAEDVDKVNNMLIGIRDLSNQIRKSQIYGGDALEARDARNVLIDELSEYVRIDATYEIEDLGGGLKVEKLVIKLAGNDQYDTSTNSAVLVDGIYAGQLSINDHPKANTDEATKAAKPYLDKDGNPTADEEAAAREYDDDYGITISQLVDRLYRPMDVPRPAMKTLADPYTTQAAAEAAIANLPTSKLVDGKMVQYEYAWEEVTEEDTTTNPPTTTTRYQVTQTAVGYGSVELTENALYGALQAEREMLTKQGEFATQAQLDVDPNANVKRGIPYYQKSLDVLANQFANAMNEANLGGPIMNLEGITVASAVPVDAIFRFSDGSCGRNVFKTVVDPNDGKEYRMFDVTNTACPTLYNANVPQRNAYTTDTAYKEAFTTWLNQTNVQASIVADDGMMTQIQKEHLLPASEGNLGHGQIDRDLDILFSNHGNGNDPAKITAANISISKSWAEGTSRIQQSLDPAHPSTDNTNLNHMLYMLQSGKISYNPLGTDLKGTAHFAEDKLPASTDVFFTGTFQEMFTENICGTLANDRQSTTTLLENHMTASDELYVDRDAVSGVDLNDEAMNLMQFQKSLNAAYRLMTVIDETLDRLINNTGVAGR